MAALIGRSKISFLCSLILLRILDGITMISSRMSALRSSIVRELLAYILLFKLPHDTKLGVVRSSDMAMIYDL